ncbi:hypothetical protein WJX73_007452 [Symbiochloris irregularis]|uniref:Uncharacterized protein n=1 Tax=Symbiochloris irregularis TaxID=706552 RepID=A0AAW1PL77_9CHLO
MAWLKPAHQGVEDWNSRLKANDPTLTAIHVFKARKFGHEEVELFGLRQLDLARNPVGNSGAEALAQSMQHLEAVDLSECSISAAEALREKPPLEILRLRGNRLGDQGAEALAEAIRDDTALVELDVGSCEVGPSGVELIAAGTHLRKLSLFDSRIGDEAVKRMAALMQAEALTALLELELSGCGIGPPGMTALFDVLQTGVVPALEVRLMRDCR